MKKYIEKYFLFLFIFVSTLSIVDVTHTFSKRRDIKEIKRFINNLTGVEDEACDEKDTSKSGIAQYSETCRKQCTSTDEKYSFFQEENRRVCKLFRKGSGRGNDKETDDDNEEDDNKEIAKIVQNFVKKLNKVDKAVVDDILPDFTTLTSKYEFTLTFDNKLRKALRPIIFANPTIKTYNIKEYASRIIRKIILESFDKAPTTSNNYNDKIIKKLRDEWLNVDLKGDANRKDTPFTVANFKATTAGTVGYSLPHELYHSDLEDTLTNAIEDNTDSDAAAKSAFLKAYKNYISKIISIRILFDTWEDTRSLEFRVSLNASAENDGITFLEDTPEITSDTREITSPASLEEINTLIPTDLSTKAAFDKIKTIFDITAERISHTDLDFKSADELFASIANTGVVPLRITITAKAPDATKRLEKAKEIFIERIVALAENAPTELGDAAHIDGTLYHWIYTATKLALSHIPNYHSNDIVNAKVIAVKKGSTSDKVSILLELVDNNEYPFSGYSGVSISYAHIVDSTPPGEASHHRATNFFAAENFKEGLVKGTTATTDCPFKIGTFYAILDENGACKNLLKIQVPDNLNIDNGADSGTDFGGWRHLISNILFTSNHIRKFTTYFNPESKDLYTSNAIRNQLKSSKSVEGFPDFINNLKNWSANEDAYNAFVNLVATGDNNRNIHFLFRSTGDRKAVYLTKLLAKTNNVVSLLRVSGIQDLYTSLRR